jgi:hypothetical protein
VIIFKQQGDLLVPGVFIPGELAIFLEMLKRNEPEAVKLADKILAKVKK